MKSKGDLERPYKGAVVFGVDQSYTGFAVTAMAPDGRYYTQCGPLDGKGVDRLIAAQGFIRGMLTSFRAVKPTVVMEGYAYGATQTAHMAGELGAAIKLEFHRWGIEPLVATPSQLKGYATGKGNAAKAEVLLGVYKNWGVEFDNDNMADSYVLARIALGEGRNERQRKVVADVTKARGEK